MSVDKLIFEKSSHGARAATIRKPDVPEYAPSCALRESFEFPELTEIALVRHYTALSRMAFGVDNGFYPLGSCTMKYNPKLNEEIASLEGFTDMHPLSPEESAQGSLEVIYELSEALKEITGMDAVTLQPAAGAHGEYTGLSIIGAYHKGRGDLARKKIIVPDSAHGTNPASAAMAGFDVVNIPSDEEKGVDLDALRAAVGEDTAALMLTNPTTLGLFEKNIEAIAEIVHSAGGLLYYDGANLNAVMGVVRPGDMGFDVVHLNLHKTFSTPHGGGGPGSGPVGCKRALEKYLPDPRVIKNKDGAYSFAYSEDSIGKVGSFYGNFLVYLKAYAYILTLGAEGIRRSAEGAVLNANYLKAGISDLYPVEGGARHCMHEFVASCERLKEECGVSAMDVAKAMIDRGMHPPTMYFPTIVHEALMFEPTETEDKATLDEAIAALRSVYDEAHVAPERLTGAPHNAAISRPDEVFAAKSQKLRWRK